MAPSPPAPGYPLSFPANSRRPDLRYRLRTDCHAVEGRVPSESESRVIYALPAENLSVVEGERSAHAGLSTRPVYAFTDSETPAVPSGRVWLECEAGRLDEAQLSELGYAVESRPPFAPDAVWLRAVDGRVATALAGLERLAALAGARAVEPEMLRPRAKRGRLSPGS